MERGDVMDIFEIVKTRRSIRTFTEDPVPAGDVSRILETAMYAARGGGSDIQPVKFIVIRNRDLLRRMADAVLARKKKIAEGLEGDARREYEAEPWFDVLFQHAPVVVAVLYRELEWIMKPLVEQAGVAVNETFGSLTKIGTINASLVCQNLMLLVHAADYGTCFINAPLVAKSMLEKILEVQPPWQLFTLMPIGKPARVPKPAKVFTLEEIAVFKE